jgi:hypothetical protein
LIPHIKLSNGVTLKEQNPSGKEAVLEKKSIYFVVSFKVASSGIKAMTKKAY